MKHVVGLTDPLNPDAEPANRTWRRFTMPGTSVWETAGHFREAEWNPEDHPRQGDGAENPGWFASTGASSYYDRDDKSLEYGAHKFDISKHDPLGAPLATFTDRPETGAFDGDKADSLTERLASEEYDLVAEPVEHGRLIMADGSIVGFVGDKDHIKIPSEYTKTSRLRDAIFTHNHPRASWGPLSLADVNMGAWFLMREVRAVTIERDANDEPTEEVTASFRFPPSMSGPWQQTALATIQRASRNLEDSYMRRIYDSKEFFGSDGKPLWNAKTHTIYAEMLRTALRKLADDIPGARYSERRRRAE